MIVIRVIFFVVSIKNLEHSEKYTNNDLIKTMLKWILFSFRIMGLESGFCRKNQNHWDQLFTVECKWHSFSTWNLTFTFSEFVFVLELLFYFFFRLYYYTVPLVILCTKPQEEEKYQRRRNVVRWQFLLFSLYLLTHPTDTYNILPTFVAYTSPINL